MINVRLEKELDYTQTRYKLLLAAYMGLCPVDLALGDLKSQESTSSDLNKLQEFLNITKSMKATKEQEELKKKLEKEIAEKNLLDYRKYLLDIEQFQIDQDAYLTKIPILLDYLKLFGLSNTPLPLTEAIKNSNSGRNRIY